MDAAIHIFCRHRIATGIASYDSFWTLGSPMGSVCKFDVRSTAKPARSSPLFAIVGIVFHFLALLHRRSTIFAVNEPASAFFVGGQEKKWHRFSTCCARHGLVLAGLLMACFNYCFIAERAAKRSAWAIEKVCGEIFRTDTENSMLTIIWARHEPVFAA
jgi:hypothetical protein